MKLCSDRIIAGRCAAIVAAIAQADPAHAEPLGGYPPLPSPVQQIFDSVRRASHEALTGVAVMVMPGDDAYSRAQRVTARGPGAVSDDGAVQFIALIDRFLPLWIAAAMALGLAAGRLIPGISDALAAVLEQGMGDLVAHHHRQFVVGQVRDRVAAFREGPGQF